MGNRKSYPSLKVSQGFQPSDWKFCSSTNEYEIIANIRNGQLAQVHQINLDPTVDYSSQLHKYQFRRTQKQNLVQVLHVQRNDDDFNCSARIWLKVIIERISFRLSEIKNLTPEEGLYTLKRALIGFKAIQELNGCMRIDDSLICVTPEGRVKVWLNDDLAWNEPEEGRLYEKTDSPQEAQSNQISMVNQIVKEVWLHVCPGLRHSSFMEAYQQECEGKPDNGISFFQALNFLQDYIIENGIELPDGVRMPNKVHKVISTRSEVDSISNALEKKAGTEVNKQPKDSKLSLKEEQRSPRCVAKTNSQKAFNNLTFNKNQVSKQSMGVSTGISTGVSVSGMPVKIPQTSNTATKLLTLERLNRQIGLKSQISINTLDQHANIQKIRAVGKSTEFTFNHSQIPIISSRQQTNSREQVILQRPSVKFSYNNIQPIQSDRPRPVSNAGGLHGLARPTVSANLIPLEPTEQRSLLENHIPSITTTPRYQQKQHIRHESTSLQPASVATTTNHLILRNTTFRIK